MTRLLAVFLILCTQVFGVLAPGTVVVCVHADGTSAIELVGALCCDTGREAECKDGCRVPDAGEKSGPSIEAAGDDCRDIPFTQEQVAVARTSVERTSNPSHDHRAVSLVAVAWTAPEQFCPVSSVPHEVMPRPPEVRLRRPCFVSLRI
ncbi:MAG: hypothetical protein HMLKMBBP_01324 [Planctomycetes bacterium]|nr:hypothetical protein [Planctomycetota bacterium]